VSEQKPQGSNDLALIRGDALDLISQLGEKRVRYAACLKSAPTVCSIAGALTAGFKDSPSTPPSLTNQTQERK